MRPGQCRGITAGILICLWTAGNAFGADLTLNIPLNLSNLRPEVNGANIMCLFYGQGGNGPKSYITSFSRGISAPVNGALNTTVKIELALDENSKNLYTKYSYSCKLQLQSGNSTTGYLVKDAGEAFPFTTIKPGTTPRTTVAGDFP